MKFWVGFIFSYILILSVFQLNSVAFKFSARLPANYQDEEVMNSILDNDVRNAHQKLDALIQLKKKLESLCKIVPALGVCRTEGMKKRGIKDLMYRKKAEKNYFRKLDEIYFAKQYMTIHLAIKNKLD